LRTKNGKIRIGIDVVKDRSDWLASFQLKIIVGG